MSSLVPLLKEVELNPLKAFLQFPFICLFSVNYFNILITGAWHSASEGPLNITDFIIDNRDVGGGLLRVDCIMGLTGSWLDLVCTGLLLRQHHTSTHNTQHTTEHTSTTSVHVYRERTFKGLVCVCMHVCAGVCVCLCVCVCM